MMNNKIFLDVTTNKYICADDTIICSFCSKNIADKPGFYFKSEYFKNSCAVSVICANCLNDRKNLRKLKSSINAETKFVYKTKLIPLSAIIYIPNKLTLVSLHSVADATNLVSDEVIDNTRYAGRPEGSCEGCKIGADVTKRLEEKDKLIESDEETKMLLSSLKTAKLMNGDKEVPSEIPKQKDTDQDNGHKVSEEM